MADASPSPLRLLQLRTQENLQVADVKQPFRLRRLLQVRHLQLLAQLCNERILLLLPFFWLRLPQRVVRQEVSGQHLRRSTLFKGLRPPVDEVGASLSVARRFGEAGEVASSVGQEEVGCGVGEGKEEEGEGFGRGLCCVCWLVGMCVISSEF